MLKAVFAHKSSRIFIGEGDKNAMLLLLALGGLSFGGCGFLQNVSFRFFESRGAVWFSCLSVFFVREA
jgi:hypothetical protein